MIKMDIKVISKNISAEVLPDEAKRKNDLIV